MSASPIGSHTTGPESLLRTQARPPLHLGIRCNKCAVCKSFYIKGCSHTENRFGLDLVWIHVQILCLQSDQTSQCVRLHTRMARETTGGQKRVQPNHDGSGAIPFKALVLWLQFRPRYTVSMGLLGSLSGAAHRCCE